MLHISDIEKRLKECPEPPEVKEMRERITEAFSNLEFFEEPHKYILHKSNGENVELPSVSTVLKQFEPHVDWDEIRIRKATREGIDPDDLKRQWEETNLLSTSNGTIVHEFAENCCYFFQGRFDEMTEYCQHRQFEKGYIVPYGPKQIAASKFYEDLLNNYNVWPVMPEAKVYTGLEGAEIDLNLNNQYCGTFDLLFAARWKDGVIRPFLADWKTNKSLINEISRNNSTTLLYPFNDMIDENQSHYTIQLSLYAMTLLQLGYKVTHRVILWLKDDATYNKIPVPDLSEKLLQII